VRFVGDRGVRTPEDAARYIILRFVESYRQHGFGLWLVEPKAEGMPAGICGLLKRGTLPGIEVGYAFLPPFRGKGYAFEAASAALGHARDVLGLHSLYAIVNPDNSISIRVLEKLGMRFERMVRLPGEESEVKLYSTDL
jgi:RimJ/RimL family protein N-acetyltransferase